MKAARCLVTGWHPQARSSLSSRASGTPETVRGNLKGTLSVPRDGWNGQRVFCQAIVLGSLPNSIQRHSCQFLGLETDRRKASVAQKVCRHEKLMWCCQCLCHADQLNGKPTRPPGNAELLTAKERGPRRPGIKEVHPAPLIIIQPLLTLQKGKKLPASRTGSLQPHQTILALGMMFSNLLSPLTPTSKLWGGLCFRGGNLDTRLKSQSWHGAWRQKSRPNSKPRSSGPSDLPQPEILGTAAVGLLCLCLRCGPIWNLSTEFCCPYNQPADSIMCQVFRIWHQGPWAEERKTEQTLGLCPLPLNFLSWLLELKGWQTWEGEPGTLVKTTKVVPIICTLPVDPCSAASTSTFTRSEDTEMKDTGVDFKEPVRCLLIQCIV